MQHLTLHNNDAVYIVTIKTAVIGYGGGRRFDLGGVVIKPGSTRQDGWGIITLTAMEGELLSAPARVLITAAGDVENTNMGWQNPEKSTVGKDWGEAPTLVEVISARLTFPLPTKRIQAWALDERGQRKAELSVDTGPNGNAAITIGPPQKTLWYEMQVK